MTDQNYILGKKPDREIPASELGKLTRAENVDATAEEVAGRGVNFWMKCWSCGEYLSRPLTPPSYQAYTCPNCGAANII